MKILKFQLAIGLNTVFLPKGSKPLCVQVQRHTPTMWVLTTDEEATEEIYVDVIATGEELSSMPGQYLGTFQLAANNFVGHVFWEPAE